MMDDKNQAEGVLRQDVESYNELFKARTKQHALDVLILYPIYCRTDELRIIGKQLIRSVTSIAANYRAAVRARSDAERFAKLCIVVEEADETVFWIELLTENRVINTAVLKPLLDEAIEILKVMSVYKKRYKK
jgi:four helix bundle protein